MTCALSIVSCVDELSIGQNGSVDHGGDHFLSWYTGDSQATEVILTPLVAGLIGHTVHLTIHALSSLALAFLTEKHDGMLGRLFKVNLDAVERVLHGLDGHGLLR